MNRCLVSAAVCLAAGLSAWADGASPALYRDAARAAKEKGAKAYVMDGLVAQWDGIENAGYGLPRDTKAQSWKDLTGNRTDIEFLSDTADKNKFCKWTTDDQALYIGANWGTGKAKVNGSLTAAHTIEICMKATSSCGTAYIFYDMPFFYYAGGATRTTFGYLYFAGYGLSGRQIESYSVSPRRGLTYSVSHDGTLDTGSLRLYFSGGIISKLTPTSTSSGTESAYLAGHPTNASSGISASFYSIRIYNRALTDEEIYWNSVVDNHRFTNMDVGCITADKSVNPHSVAYSSETLEVSPNTFDWMATEGIDFSSMPTGGIIVVR